MGVSEHTNVHSALAITFSVGINGSTDIAKSRILQERGKTIQARY